MNFRITDDGNERDIHEIHEMLRDYNLRHREASENVPLGVFLEDETGRKFAGLTGETFGNWLCAPFLLTSVTALSYNNAVFRCTDSPRW